MHVINSARKKGSAGGKLIINVISGRSKGIVSAAHVGLQLVSAKKSRSCDPDPTTCRSFGSVSEFPVDWKIAFPIYKMSGCPDMNFWLLDVYTPYMKK